MPSSFDQARRTAAFILNEGNGDISRENGTVKSGEDLAAGTVVMLSGAELVAHDGLLDTAGDVITEAVGVLIEKVDASSSAIAAAYIARYCTVNNNVMTYPTESTAGGEKAAVNASLDLLGIIVR